MEKKSLPLFFWLVIPVLAIIAQIVLEHSFTSQELSRIHSEGGPHEILQEITIICALGFAIQCLAKLDWHTQRPIGIVCAVAALGCFYIAGEEVSWGQQAFHWATPETWAVVNDQNETNLHNTSDWLDQKPRLLLFIGICIAGLIVPAVRRWKPETLPVKYAFLYPSNTLVVVSLGVLLPYAVQELGEHFLDMKFFKRVSEVQELYMYYFVALYLKDLYNRKIHKP